MKRTPKPFAVEIKKSRGSSRRHPVPPKRSFEITPVENTSVFKETAQLAGDLIAAPRILPSILERMWSNSRAVEPVHHKRSPRSRPNLGDMGADPNASVAQDQKDALPEMSVIEQGASQPDPVIIPEEAIIPADGVQPHQTAEPEAASRKKAPKRIEPAMATESVAPEPSSKAEVIKPLSRRQAAAAQLRRQERWKRRLHPAAW